MADPRKRGKWAELDDLPDGWQDKVIAIYRDGGNDVEVKAMLREVRGSMSNDLWYRWLKDEPEFAEIIELGHELAQAWWERLGRQGASGAVQVNPALWIFTMKNRFGWTDRQHVEVKGDIHQTHEHRAVSEVDSRIAEMLGQGKDAAPAKARTH